MASSSGYVHCACRDCFEIAIGVAGRAFCSDCEEAGCPDTRGQPGMSQECMVEREAIITDSSGSPS